MKVAVSKERRAQERRVAASPETVRKLVALGVEVAVEAAAGLAAAMTDEAYVAAGATIAPDYATAVAGADVVLKVQRPLTIPEGGPDELASLKAGAVLVGMLAPFQDRDLIRAYAAHPVRAFSMELIPRITRAQSMDVLSSQANLAGYKAVLDAASIFSRALPMMMTAAGTVPPARVFIMGAGVAGLQAIATAKRLGAIVSATDVRPATREQVESLGGTFVAVEDDEFRQAQSDGGYAREMSAAYQEKQRALIAQTIARQDIVITTALVPGRKAPILMTNAMVQSMKPGSVIVDLAVEQGGNVEGSSPGQVVEVNGVHIVGHINMPARIATDASALYARNLLAFLTPMINKDGGTLNIDDTDEIVKATCLTDRGHIVHPSFTEGS